MNHWHYRVITYKLKWKGFDYAEVEQQLNAYGAEGWEMVNTISPSFGSGQTIEVAVVLKRPA